MANSNNRQHSIELPNDAPAIEYDDGGSGILAASKARFASCDCTITCDERHTVWIKRTDGSRSVGLSPWQVSRRPMDELLEDVAERLGLKPLAQ